MINSVSSGGFYPAITQAQSPPNAGQMAEDLLSAADTDNDGSISKAEFNTLVESQNSDSSESISGLFSQMDADGDESVSLDEATEAISSLLQQLQEQRMANQGAMPPPPPPPGGGSAEELLSSADTDEDGGLNIDEFTAALKRSDDEDDSILAKMFDETDTDGDGIVSQEELQTAMENKQNSQTQSSTNTDSNVSMLVNSLLQQYQQNAANSTNDTTLSIVA
ncbi:MAG: EF-hand domain-containing protein [Colwellia sp.]